MKETADSLISFCDMPRSDWVYYAGDCTEMINGMSESEWSLVAKRWCEKDSEWRENMRESFDQVRAKKLFILFEEMIKSKSLSLTSILSLVILVDPKELQKDEISSVVNYLKNSMREHEMTQMLKHCCMIWRVEVP